MVYVDGCRDFQVLNLAKEDNQFSDLEKEVADLVSQVKLQKHYFYKGAKARQGVLVIMKSGKKLEFILNGKSWSGSEANLTFLIHPFSSLKKMWWLWRRKKNIMSFSFKKKVYEAVLSWIIVESKQSMANNI